MELIKLNRLNRGELARVVSVGGERGTKQRLLDLGMTRGSDIRCEIKRKNISAYLIKGCVIALRGRNAERVIVEVDGKNG